MLCVPNPGIRWGGGIGSFTMVALHILWRRCKGQLGRPFPLCLPPT